MARPKAQARSLLRGKQSITSKVKTGFNSDADISGASWKMGKVLFTSERNQADPNQALV